MGGDISFKRMHFRGREWCSVYSSPGSHLDYIQSVKRKGEDIPLTINICTPPAVTLVAAAGPVKAIVPHGTEELGIAGALQGSPIAICRASTVDAYAIANSEWVIEGYLTPEPCWETEEAEKLKKSGVAPLFPEWHGYLGKAILGKRIKVTAITRRKDRPIFYSPMADSYEAENLIHPLAEASIYQLLQQIAPDFTLDMNTPHALKQVGGLVLQVKKTSVKDDRRVREILLATLNASQRNLVVAVDEDVDIYSTDDILWAMWTRGIPEKRVFRLHTAGTPEVVSMNIPSRADGVVGIDATLPFATNKSFKRAHYPVDRVTLTKWFSDDELIAARQLQSEYARIISQMGT
jgi:4-hydroxy-3-polyprenylbenzoate decarboxylase